MDHDLVKSITSIVQTVTGVLIPVVVLAIGLKINKSLEATKAAISREKDWKTKWAEHFYAAATSFAKSVDESAILFNQIQENSNAEKSAAQQERHQVLFDDTKNAFADLIKWEWLLQTQLHFAPKSQASVMTSTQLILEQLRIMTSTGRGSFEDLRKHMKAFHEASRSAHREMLES